MEQETFWVQVDEWGNWSPCKYREVTADELDKLIDLYGKRVLQLVSRGREGAMVMWAVFKNRITGEGFSDLSNAYRLLTDDTPCLLTREHELRHAYEQWEELFRIRYYGSVAAYYLHKADEATKYIQRHRGNYTAETTQMNSAAPR